MYRALFVPKYMTCLKSLKSEDTKIFQTGGLKFQDDDYFQSHGEMGSRYRHNAVFSGFSRNFSVVFLRTTGIVRRNRCTLPGKNFVDS